MYHTEKERLRIELLREKILKKFSSLHLSLNFERGWTMQYKLREAEPKEFEGTSIIIQFNKEVETEQELSKLMEEKVDNFQLIDYALSGIGDWETYSFKVDLNSR